MKGGQSFCIPSVTAFRMFHCSLISEHVKGLVSEVFELREEMRLLRQQIAASFVEKNADFPMSLPAKTIEEFEKLNKLLEDDSHRKNLVSVPFYFCEHNDSIHYSDIRLNRT